MARITVSEQFQGIEFDKKRRIDNNTIEYYQGNIRKIRLHRTDIIEFHENFIVLNSGGWKTNTTKDRINEYCKFGNRIWQEKGIWTVSNSFSQKSAIFFDGIKISYNGDFLNAENAPSKSDIIALSKKIKEYSKNFIDQVRQGNIKLPNSGDCWYCLMKTQNDNTLGEESSSEHIINHIDENYFVPSLIFRACEVMPTSPACKSWLYNKCSGNSDADFYEGFASKQAQTALVRYIKRQLSIAA